MTKKVTVLDYGSGNIHSAVRALAETGAEVSLTADKSELIESDGMVIPGVGAYAAVMRKLSLVGAAEIVDKRLTASRPVLGICVGMQVMFASGREHGEQTDGLGQWPGEVTKLEAETLPHIGWTKVEPEDGSSLFDGVEEERFYFVHSYAAKNWELDVRPPFVSPKLTWAEHGERFIAAVENGPLSATQFHPEKSGRAGLQLLKNWTKTL
ncbi:MAG: imidazole glycerol phosphate synthase subunit HisH [Candidatus Aquiluna sp. XM-24bin5]|nr:MAG: imidazole glycerol phosphate synthase subunit HisH [Candidatus Aquiluna sp. XM-24bin5]